MVCLFFFWLILFPHFFLLEGYCPNGEACTLKHTLTCPAFSETGVCPDGAKCKLKHAQPKRALADAKLSVREPSAFKGLKKRKVDPEAAPSAIPAPEETAAAGVEESSGKETFSTYAEDETPKDASDQPAVPLVIKPVFEGEQDTDSFLILKVREIPKK